MSWEEKNSEPTNFKTTNSQKSTLSQKFSKGNFISLQNSSFLEHLLRAATEAASVVDMNAVGLTPRIRKNKALNNYSSNK